MIRSFQINTWRKRTLVQQIICAVAVISFSTIVCFLFRQWIGYQVVAFVLLLMVSFLAIVLDRFPVLIGALLSALFWDFLFIRPYYTFAIAQQEDIFLLLMYFVIALLNVFITSNIKKAEQIQRDKEQQKQSIILYNSILQSLSHELRTPITRIIGAVDTLQEQKELSETHQADLLKSIELSSLHLHDQVEKLLSQSRLDSGNIQPVLNWCSLEEIFQNLPSNFLIAKKKRIALPPNLDTLPLIRMDEGLLTVAIDNIIQNAQKYSPDDSLIEVIISFQNGVSISVLDTGDGINESEIQIIKEKFKRGKNTISGGLGLGLSITEGFITALGGKLEIQNRATKGLQVSLFIPAEIRDLKEIDHD